MEDKGIVLERREEVRHVRKDEVKYQHVEGERGDNGVKGEDNRHDQREAGEKAAKSSGLIRSFYLKCWLLNGALR